MIGRDVSIYFTLERKMSHTKAAILAICFAIVGWLLVTYGILSQLGDPYPSVTAEELQRMHRISFGILFTGILVEATAWWLSGYSFVAAKALASVAIVASVAGFGLFIAFLV